MGNRGGVRPLVELLVLSATTLPAAHDMWHTADDVTGLKPSAQGVDDAGLGFALYDSFAARRFTGNVAGVVVSDRELPEGLMRSIAAELSAPTTGFAIVHDGGDVAIRYFTPKQEIRACGHVSLAIATELVGLGVWRAAPNGCHNRAATQAGYLSLLLIDTRLGVRVELTYRPKAAGGVPMSREQIESMLGGIPTDSHLPIEVVATGLRHLMVPFTSRGALGEMAPDETSVRELARSCAVDTICAFTVVGDHTLQMRDFCAGIGVLEEPASGTTSSALAWYADRHEILRSRVEFPINQGVEMGRPSVIEVVLGGDGDGPLARVRGRAIKTAFGTMILR